MPSVNFETLISGAVGAFLAAWTGAHLAFRRSRKERALDRRVGWHEDAIQTLARYEERLEKLHSRALNVLVVQGTQIRRSESGETALSPADLPKTIKVPAALWQELTEAEEQARASLRLAEPYTEGRTQLECSVALSTTVNLVAGQWFDLSSEPEIPWVELRAKAMAVANLRRSVQDSLRLVLELDGPLVTIFGLGYRRWRTLRKLSKLSAELAGRPS